MVQMKPLAALRALIGKLNQFDEALELHPHRTH